MSELKTFSLWVEGYAATGDFGTATFYARVEGVDFNEAVRAYVEKLPPGDKKYWSFDAASNQWRMWGCRAFDNEADARRAFG